MLPLTVFQRKTMAAVVSHYEQAVTAELAEWLMDRGLTEETSRGNRLGEVRDPFPGHEAMRGWLCIPYLDKDGKPLTVRFRRPDWLGMDNGPKYRSLPNDPARMYNIGAIHRAVRDHEEILHLTEGELDALILQQCGFPAVAVPGATSFKGRHRVMLAGFSKVLIWGDGDEAGARMVASISKMMRQAVPIMLPRGQDVTDVYAGGGREALVDLIERWSQDDEQEEE